MRGEEAFPLLILGGDPVHGPGEHAFLCVCVCVQHEAGSNGEDQRRLVRTLLSDTLTSGVPQGSVDTTYFGVDLGTRRTSNIARIHSTHCISATPQSDTLLKYMK